MKTNIYIVIKISSVNTWDEVIYIIPRGRPIFETAGHCSKDKYPNQEDDVEKLYAMLGAC